MYKFSKKFKILFFTVYCLLIIFACISSALSGEKSSNSSGLMIKLLHFIPPYRFFLIRIPDLDFLIRKLIGHYSLYILIGASGSLFYLSIIKNSYISNTINILSGIFLASITEIIQIFASDRGPALQDVIINFQGYLTASMIIGTAYVIIKTIKNTLPISEFEVSLCFNSLSAVISTIIFIFATDGSRSIIFCNKIFLFIFTFSLILSFLCTNFSKKTQINKK